MQGPSRLLNHSRFPAFRKYRRSVRCRAQPVYLLTPSGRFALCATAHRADASLRRAHGFAALANIGVLRAGRAQPLYLLTPAGRFALRATAHRADASLRCAAGRFGPSAQVPTGHTLPFAPCRGLGQTPGRSIVAEGAGRAHRSFRSLANIGVLCAGRAQPLYLLTPSGRFGPLAQQPTGLTLPSGAPKTCAAAQNASVASARRAQETRHAPLSQKSHERPSTPSKKPPAPAQAGTGGHKARRINQANGFSVG